MEGLPRTPILFSLKRVDGSPEAGAFPNAPASRRQKLPTVDSGGTVEISGGAAPTRIMRIRRHGRIARWRRKGIRLLRRVQSLSRYRRPLIAASLIVLVAGGGYQAGHRIVKAFTMQHEIVATPAPIPEEFVAEEIRQVRTQRTMAARNVAVPRDVLPERFSEPVKGPEVEEGPLLKLSAEGPPEAYQRQVRQTVYQADEEMRASRFGPPVIQANGSEYRSSPSNLLGGIETDFSSHREQQIHVTPGPGNR